MTRFRNPYPEPSRDPSVPPDRCPRCQSTHFHMATFSQYQVFTTGGYRLLGNTRQAIVCVCGQPKPVSKENSRDQEDQEFKESLKVAKDYHERTGPERLMGELKRDYITLVEFQALSDQVGALEAVLQQLSKKDKKDDQKAPG